ncbi:MAG: McbB family protein [Gammaproteobacteria bacterium]|nr:McbB family protein [Gammaproteobacteria bacterium]
MYVINDYQLINVASNLYIINDGKGAKISHQHLIKILNILQQQDKLEITEEALAELAQQYQIDLTKLKTLLITQLNVLKPMLARKFPLIYIDTDDLFIANMLKNSLEKEYRIALPENSHSDFSSESLIIFYRQNYTHDDFKQIHHNLADNSYLITAGVIHKLLLIDNLYFNHSGLPTHFSNLHQLNAYLYSEMPAPQNNWLLFYRDIVKNNQNNFPDPALNACQKGYIAYCLYQFVSQYTNLWNPPTPLDQINWFWHVDLTTFNVHSEVAIHSPFSEYDMKLNSTSKKQQDLHSS